MRSKLVLKTVPKILFGITLLFSFGCAVEHQSYTDGYHIIVNGCDTGKHEFESDDEGDVQQKICAALQDEDLNNRCAHNERKDTFAKKCPGAQWSPN